MRTTEVRGPWQARNKLRRRVQTVGVRSHVAEAIWLLLFYFPTASFSRQMKEKRTNQIEASIITLFIFHFYNSLNSFWTISVFGDVPDKQVRHKNLQAFLTYHVSISQVDGNQNDEKRQHWAQPHGEIVRLEVKPAIWQEGGGGGEKS